MFLLGPVYLYLFFDIFVYFVFVVVWLSVPVQSIAWKDSSRKRPIVCQVGR